MHHNEDAYPESDAFKPERFFVEGELSEDKSIDSLAFGFGRYLTFHSSIESLPNLAR